MDSDCFLNNPLVAGGPLAMAAGPCSWVEVPLITGQRLSHRRTDGLRLLSRVALALRARASSPPDVCE